MHYFSIIIIVFIIVFIQIKNCINTFAKLNLFKSIFPSSHTDFELVQIENSLEIQSQHNNVILDNILSTLNRYLNNNRGAVSDYHLMKDTVERNCYTIEEEIQTQIPVPLYFGLVGTMLGILFGIGFLVISGGLHDLLTSSEKTGSEGIETLLGGIAIAMISSILGIILTTLNSSRSKNVKKYVEKKKDIFLSWIQSELLPNISNDVSSALSRMARNLSTFNNTFSQNTKELQATLSKVNESYQTQADLIQAINKLKIKDIATANIEVYDKLKNSTNEIGVFAEYLRNANDYLKSIQELNHKLDNYERRTQIIENAGRFFSKNEKWLAENFDIANLEVSTAISRFKANTGESLTKLHESLSVQILNLDGVMQKQQEKLKESLTVTTEIISESFAHAHQAFEGAITEQQNAFKTKLYETTRLIEELKNLTHIKESVSHFKEAINRQNAKIDELVKEIRTLANVKVDGGSHRQIYRIPKWIKIIAFITFGLFAISYFFYIIPAITELVTKIGNWLF